MATSGSDDITGENLYFTGKQWKQGVYEGQPQKWRWTGGTQKGWMVLAFHCRHPGHVVVKCIADMPQEVKDQAQLMSQEKINWKMMTQLK